MKKLGRNTFAVGMATLLVTSAASLSANAAEEFTSYSEAQFIASGGGLGALVDPLGDALESNQEAGTSGAVACDPAQPPSCDNQAFTSSPLQALDALSGPLGDALGADIGPAGNFAFARDGASRAASGAVTNDGIVNVGGAGAGAAPANATLNLTGPDSALNPIAGLANVQLDTGAVAAEAELDSPDAAVSRDYALAGGTLTLTVPALATVNTTLGGALSQNLPSTLTLNAQQACLLILDIPPTLFPGSPTLPGSQVLCEALAQLNQVGSLTVNGLNTISAGLTTVTRDGITFDFTAGAIRINLKEAFERATGRNLNELPPNTEILREILPGLVLQLDQIVASVKTDLIDQLNEELSVSGTLLGIQLPALELSQLRDAGLGTLVDAIFAGLDTALVALEPVADGLDTLVGALNPLLRLTVNVPDTYRDLVVEQRGADVTPAAAGDIFSQTALRVEVGPEAAAADILLANALVGPNGSFDVDDAADDGLDGAAAGDDLDGTIADADTDGVDGGVGDGGGQGDADVVTSLPNAGAPNLLPFWLLGAGLVLFGGAVLLNERRRTALI